VFLYCAIPGHGWTVSAQAKADVVLTCINGVLPHLHFVTAESSRPWSTLSTRVRSQNWMAACWASMKRITLSSAGWRWQRRRHSRNECIALLRSGWRLTQKKANFAFSTHVANTILQVYASLISLCQTVWPVQNFRIGPSLLNWIELEQMIQILIELWMCTCAGY